MAELERRTPATEADALRARPPNMVVLFMSLIMSGESLIVLPTYLQARGAVWMSMFRLVWRQPPRRCSNPQTFSSCGAVSESDPPAVHAGCARVGRMLGFAAFAVLGGGDEERLPGRRRGGRGAVGRLAQRAPARRHRPGLGGNESPLCSILILTLLVIP